MEVVRSIVSADISVVGSRRTELLRYKPFWSLFLKTTWLRINEAVTRLRYRQIFVESYEHIDPETNSQIICRQTACQSRCYHVNVNEYSVKNLEYYGISSTFLQLPMDTQKFSAVRALVHYNHTTRWFNHKGQSHAWFVLFYDFSKLDVVHLGRESGSVDDSAWRSCDVRFSRKFNLHKTLSISHR